MYKMKLSQRLLRRKRLEQLVTDCITYDLNEREALEYIKLKYKQINPRYYYVVKERVSNDSSMQIWLYNFSKIGFVAHHRKLLDDMLKVQKDSMNRLFRYMHSNPRNEKRILELKHDIRENTKLLSELGLGTPIIAAVKAKIQELANNMQEKDNETRVSGVSEQNGNGNGTVLEYVPKYPEYDKFISRTVEDNELTENESDVTESENETETKGLENGNDDPINRQTEKRIRTRNDEFIERGANTTDRVF
jgi:hypothetical protein